VISIVPTADRQKATVRVRIAFDQLDPRILPDMGIKVRFLEEGAGSAAPVPTVAGDAIVRSGDATSVWVVNDGRAERRAVRLGPERDGRFPVLEGLVGGETVVMAPPERLRDGAAVKTEAE
jgi:multidrug efflux pump subunit AcrA (membrane-fusion protein)